MEKCPYCQYVEEQLNSCGLTHIIEVPTLKWESVNMDFMVSFPKYRRQPDSIWVVVERMTKSATLTL